MQMTTGQLDARGPGLEGNCPSHSGTAAVTHFRAMDVLGTSPDSSPGGPDSGFHDGEHLIPCVNPFST